jgi:hypothetical protein
MKEVIVILIAGHLLSDFVLQTNWIAQAKQLLRIQLLHALIVAAVTTALLGALPAGLIAAVFATHLLIDLVKSWQGSRSVWVFIIDQIAHAAALTGMAAAFSAVFHQSIWHPYSAIYLNGLILISGLILAVPAGSILIGKATAPLVEQLDSTLSQGLTNGGKWIGQLERALTFMLVLTGQVTAIGFLFASKSILRFGEIKEPSHRKQSEYIIIGTLMSFGWALFIANLTGWAMRLW